MIRPAGVGMAVWEHQGPIMLGCLWHQLIEVLDGGDVEGEVIEARPTSVMVVAARGGRLLDHDVGGTEASAAAVRPLLVGPVTEGFEQPPPAGDRSRQIGDPQLDVVQLAVGHLDQT